jgi:hypothetical protein
MQPGWNTTRGRHVIARQPNAGRPQQNSTKHLISPGWNGIKREGQNRKRYDCYNIVISKLQFMVAILLWFVVVVIVTFLGFVVVCRALWRRKRSTSSFL